MRKTAGVIAIDNGGFSTCIKTKTALTKFPSAKGKFHERNLSNALGKNEFIFELSGEKYFAGNLAEQAYLPLQMHTDTKQHIFYDLSILAAIHMYGFDINYVVTCVPIKRHNQEEKEGIKDRLVGEWTFSINNERKTFRIDDVIIAPEGVSSFWNHMDQGMTHWVDWGSRTINYATVKNDGENMRFIDSQSGTFFGKGLEALEDLPNIESLADFVAGRLSAKWDKNNKVYHVGGGALNKQLIKQFSSYFPNSEVHPNPQTANVSGMYLLGRSVFDIVTSN